MTVTNYAFTPAPRRGDSELAAMPDHAFEDFLEAAETLADAHPGAETPCMSDPSCGRAGSVIVVTEEDTVLACGLHAMRTVFTASGLVGVVRPDGS